MKMSANTGIPLVRKLVTQHGLQVIESCLTDTVACGHSDCLPGVTAEEAIDLLAKSAFVRKSIEREGMTIQQAMRVLGVQMRQFSRKHLI